MNQGRSGARERELAVMEPGAGRHQKTGLRRRLFTRLLAVGLASAGLGLAMGCTQEDSQVPMRGPEHLQVMTFNVMCSFCGNPDYDYWDTRLGYFQDIFERHDPDLIGLQELAFRDEVEAFLELAPRYSAVFYRIPETTRAYPDATILYRTERFELLDSGQYWLSPTPDKPQSTGFVEQQLPRLVVWAKLKDRHTRRTLYFASTHVDNNTPSQQLSAPLILERAEPWAKEGPVIFVGDFNSKPDTEAYRILTEQGTPQSGFKLVNSLDLAASWQVDTNEAEEPAYSIEDNIDHIFLGSQPGAWEAWDWRVDIHRYGEKQAYASDHFPMVVKVKALD